jgi:hypothetical protein
MGAERDRSIWDSWAVNSETWTWSHGHGQTETNLDEGETGTMPDGISTMGSATLQDETTVGSATDDEEAYAGNGRNEKTSNSLCGNETFERVLSTNGGNDSCHMAENGTWVCHPYKLEKLERELFNNSPGAGRRSAIIETLQKSESCLQFILDICLYACP